MTLAMHRNFADADHAIESLLGGALTEQILPALKAIASSPEVSEYFVKNLVAQQARDGNDVDDVLETTLAILERMAASAKTTACIFMTYLWVLAGNRQGMHDICDTIDLWIDDNNGVDLIPHLNRITEAADTEPMRARFHNAAGRIKMKASAETDAGGCESRS